MKEGAMPAITDYGLAKLLDDIPCSTSGEGTMNYRAPELLKHPAQRRSKASDVYALAGVLYAVSINCLTEFLFTYISLDAHLS